MTPSELLIAPATAPERSAPEVGDVRTALQRLRDEASTKGAELQARSNESWATRKRNVFDSLQIVRESVATARAGLFNILGGVRALREQSDLRDAAYEQVSVAIEKVYDKFDDATFGAAERAADRAVEKGLAVIAKAEARIPEIRVASKAATLRGKAGIYTTLARGSEMVAQVQDKRATSHARWADRLHRIGDKVDSSVAMGRRAFQTGWHILGEALVATNPFRNPLRSPARMLERSASVRRESVVRFAGWADSCTSAAERLKAERAALRPSTTPNESVPFTQVDQNGAGATPEVGAFRGSIPSEAVSFGLDQAAQGSPLPVSANPRYNAV